MIFFLNHQRVNITASFLLHHEPNVRTNKPSIQSKFEYFSFLLADTVTPLVRQLKSSCSVQENGDNDRPVVSRRRPSVLDEKALREADTKLIRDQRIQAISRSYQGILESIGEDPTRQGKKRFFVDWNDLSAILYLGLLKTPKRAAEVKRF